MDRGRSLLPRCLRMKPTEFIVRTGLGIFLLVLIGHTIPPAAGQDTNRDGSVNWPAYLGDKASSQFSPLAEITPANVHRLAVAWVYSSGDARSNNRSQIQCNPLIIDGVLFGTSPLLKLFALDARTGREKWRFDPFADSQGKRAVGVNRGLVYWEADDGADGRILYCADHFLRAIDAQTGRPISTFGTNGRVDLKDHLGRDAGRLSVLSNTPGILYRDLLILGTRVSEGPGPSAPGHIRAYDVRTGELRWIFHTIPQPGEFGYETWPPDAWQRVGGANCWTGMAVDEERGIVFCPTGSPAFDFWGGNRLGENLFGNCLLALDAASGKRLWHYQFVRHDLWDRDLPAPPNLLTVRRDGMALPAVAQVTKSGHVFVFHRETGEPLFPIEDIPVPPSDLQGESAWPTQPVPTLPEPFARQTLTYNELTDVSPESRRAVLDQFSRLRTHMPFMPPSTEGTIIFPGFDGGGEWGGAAADPNSGILYVNGNEMPWILTMIPTKRDPDETITDGRRLYMQICAACHGINREGDPQRTFPTLVGVESKMSEADVINLLNTGRGVMPSVAFLTESQKRAVSRYVLGSEPEPAAVVADGSEPETDDVVDAIGRAPYGHTGYNRWFDPDGYPAVKPPWGTLNAIDLNSGEYLWRTTLGEFPELTARGVPPTGTENYGGPVATAGGLLFIGASKDEHFRAFDRSTGELLWQTRLPAGGYATPATYAIDGKQYVVIACGGGKMGTPSGDSYLAFTLTEN